MYIYIASIPFRGLKGEKKLQPSGRPAGGQPPLNAQAPHRTGHLSQRRIINLLYRMCKLSLETPRDLVQWLRLHHIALEQLFFASSCGHQLLLAEGQGRNEAVPGSALPKAHERHLTAAST